MKKLVCEMAKESKGKSAEQNLTREIWIHLIDILDRSNEHIEIFGCLTRSIFDKVQQRRYVSPRHILLYHNPNTYHRIQASRKNTPTLLFLPPEPSS
jgi:hypothetical protein